MFLFKLFMGLKNALALIPKRRGRLYVTTDSGELYADISNSQRKQIGYSRGDIDFKFNSERDYVDSEVSNIGDDEHPLKGQFRGECEGDNEFRWQLKVDWDGTLVFVTDFSYGYE